MQRKSAKFLCDMLDAAKAIQENARDHTVDDYLEQRWLRDSVNWNFCVIGEALSKLKQIDETTVERITDHWKIIGFRNQLIHGYGLINNRITWHIIEEKLPVLIQELEQLLKQ